MTDEDGTAACGASCRQDRQLAMEVRLHQLAVDVGLDQQQRRDARKGTMPTDKETRAR